MRVFVCVKNGIHTTGTSHCGYYLFIFFYHSLFVFLNKHFSKHSYIFLSESVRSMSTIHPLIFFSPVPLFFSFFCCFSIWYMGPACQASRRFPPVSVISAFLFRFLLFFTAVHRLKGTWLNLSLLSFSLRALYPPHPFSISPSPLLPCRNRMKQIRESIRCNHDKWVPMVSRDFACMRQCVCACVRLGTGLLGNHKLINQLLSHQHTLQEGWEDRWMDGWNDG